MRFDRGCKDEGCTCGGESVPFVEAIEDEPVVEGFECKSLGELRASVIDAELLACEAPKVPVVNGRQVIERCGHCEPCRKARTFSSEAASMLELATHSDVFGGTATYSVEHLPIVDKPELRPVYGVYGYDYQSVKAMFPLRLQREFQFVQARLRRVSGGRFHGPDALRKCVLREYGFDIGEAVLLAETDHLHDEHGNVTQKRYVNVQFGLERIEPFMDCLSPPRMLNATEVYSNFHRGADDLEGLQKGSREYERMCDKLNYEERRTLVPADFQDFLHRLRKRIVRNKDVRLRGLRLRIYYVGEYGTRHGRPHFHFVVFGIPFLCLAGHPQGEVATRCKEWFCRMFQEAWPFGQICISNADGRWFSYMLKDYHKSLRRLSDDGALEGRVREFSHGSNRGGGLGATRACVDVVVQRLENVGDSLKDFVKREGDVPTAFEEKVHGNRVVDVSGPEPVIRRDRPTRELMRPYRKRVVRTLRAMAQGFSSLSEAEAAEVYLGRPQALIDDRQMALRKGAGLPVDLDVSVDPDEVKAKLLVASRQVRANASAKARIREARAAMSKRRRVD